MKNITKAFTAIVAALALISMVLPAFAADTISVGATPVTVVQQGVSGTAPTWGTATWTNTINASSSWTNMSPINATGKRELWLQWSDIPDATLTGTTTAVIWIYSNVDGNNAGSAASLSSATTNRFAVPGSPFTIPMATNAATKYTTNVLSLPLIEYTGTLPPYVYIGVISNSCGAGNLTNFSIKAWMQ